MSGPTQTGTVALVVLAAGAGTRMKSRLPKSLHPVAGIPMIDHVLRAGAAINPVSTTVVISRGLSELESRLASQKIGTVLQDPPRGTGDAVRCALDSIGDATWIVILYADHPRLTGAVVRNLVDGAIQQDAKVTVLTCIVEDAAAYGRIERDNAGNPRRIVEKSSDDPARRIGSVEVNSGMMVVDAAWARDALPRLAPDPIKGEYFLTDLVALAVAEAEPRARSWPVSTVSAESEIIHGVNDRVELAAADLAIRSRIRRKHMLNGVTIVAPETVLIDEDVTIDGDTTILPCSMIAGRTSIGTDCQIGPHAVITNASIGDRVRVQSSTITDSTIENDADIGPYSHIRRGTSVGQGTHVGNFVEIKNSVLDQQVKVGHVAYLGDAHVGEEANIGAGTITCNFDGVAKHHTTIGRHAFIGSDTMLVAPVAIGDDARTGAGSVVTHDVPPGETVVGVPARPLRAKKSEEDGV